MIFIWFKHKGKKDFRSLNPSPKQNLKDKKKKKETFSKWINETTIFSI